MRFMMIVKGNADTEAGVMPPMELLEQMGKFNEEMVAAGVMLAGEGLQPTSKGAKVQYKPGQKPLVIDGPFAETKEIFAGYWLIQVASKEEAIAWALKCPNPAGSNTPGEIEIRQVFESADFGPEIEAQEDDLRRRMEANNTK